MTQKKERVQKFNEIKGLETASFQLEFRNEEMQTLYQQYLAFQILKNWLETAVLATARIQQNRDVQYKMR